MITVRYRLVAAATRCAPRSILVRGKLRRTQISSVISTFSCRSIHHTEILRNSENLLIEIEHQSTQSDNNLTENTEPNGLIKENVPWYLRIETPKPPGHPFSPQMILPELPENSPPALEPLIQELSGRNNITELKIIDLRPLDPPPAIGANTIMIIGTARSVRHLHAAADKICRWLRSTYKARPHADGLLGRGELKQINRRKQRRGKVVSEQMGEVEESGNANWVCLEAGTDGLIAQLFTQGKREEIDIEQLWQTQLERYHKRVARNEEKMALLQSLQADELAQKQEQSESNITSERTPAVAMPSVSGPIIQTRAYSNAVRRVYYDEDYRIPVYPRKPRVEIKINQASQPEPELGFKYPILEGILYNLHTHLDPSSLLGSNPGDQVSTPFLETFYQALSKYPDSVKIGYQLKFLSTANKYNPSFYPVKSLLDYLQVSRAQGKTISLEHYYIALECISSARSASESWREASDERLSNALSLLKNLIRHLSPAGSAQSPDETEAILSRPEFKYALFKTVAPDNVSKIRELIIADGMETNEFFEHVANFGLHLWHPRISTYDHFPRDGSDALFSYTIKEHHLDMLTALAMSGQWHELWMEWNKLPLHGINRGAEYYQLVLGLALLSKRQKTALKCARILPQSMIRETPAVGLGHRTIARDVLKLLNIAEGDRTNLEFNKLKRDCEKALKIQ